MVRSLVEKLVTRAKRGGNMDVNRVRSEIADAKTERVFLSEAKTRFAARTSGYTRIVKFGPRAGDSSEEVLLSFVDARPAPIKAEPAVKKETVKKETVKKTPGKKPVKKTVRKKA
jgi:large subunit ribosomal protein L17